MTTAVLLGLMLAFEPKEPGIMDRPPRPPGSAIVTRGVLARIVVAGLILLVCAFGIFEWAEERGLGDAGARTAAVNVFMSVQIFYLVACRSLRRSLFTYNPFGQPDDTPRGGRGRRAPAAVHVRSVHERRLRHGVDLRVGVGGDRRHGLGTMVFMDLIGVALRRLRIA